LNFGIFEIKQYYFVYILIEFNIVDYDKIWIATIVLDSIETSQYI